MSVAAYNAPMRRLGDTILRAVEPDDLDATRRWRNDPDVAIPAMGRRFPITSAGEQAWFQQLSVGAFPTHVVFAVADPQSSIVGLVQLYDIEWIHRTASFGIWIGPEHWNRGHASRATQMAVEYGMHELGLRQVRLSVLATNEVAIRTYVTLGFVQEGVQRGAALIGGRPVDLILMCCADRTVGDDAA
jgi:RimJ/RimL family protein N-acetyltransferase